jgi:hypothetical protein
MVLSAVAELVIYSHHILYIILFLTKNMYIYTYKNRKFSILGRAVVLLSTWVAPPLFVWYIYIVYTHTCFSLWVEFSINYYIDVVFSPLDQRSNDPLPWPIQSPVRYLKLCSNCFKSSIQGLRSVFIS